MEEEERTNLSRSNNSHRNPRGIKPSSTLPTNSSRTPQNSGTAETAAPPGHLGSIQEGTGRARGARHTIWDTARTGVGTSLRKVRRTDRQTLQAIKECPPGQPKTQRLTLREETKTAGHLWTPAARVPVSHPRLSQHLPHTLPQIRCLIRNRQQEVKRQARASWTSPKSACCSLQGSG